MSGIATRTLELLSLLQAQREWDGDQLADRLGVSSRTVRRDITRLRELGYPVDAGKGPGGVYRLSPGRQLPPMVLDDDQAIAIALALRTAPSSVQGIDDSTARALRTVQDLLPPHLARRLRTFDVRSIDNAWDLAPPKVPSALLASLSAAAQECEVVKFVYRTRSGADGVAVVAEPHTLVVWSSRWFLVAYVQGVEAWHAYRLDRIAELRSPGWRFTPRQFPAGDVARFVQQQPDRGDSCDAWPCVGTVRMVCPAELVATWAPGGANVERIDAATTRITMGAWSWAGLLGLLATFDCDFVVEEPAELARAATRMSARLGVAGDASTPTPPAERGGPDRDPIDTGSRYQGY